MLDEAATARLMTSEEFEALGVLLGGTPGSAAHEALRLVLLEGLTQLEAAGRTGISHQAVGRKVERARVLLRAAQILHQVEIPAKRKAS